METHPTGFVGKLGLTPLLLLHQGLFCIAAQVNSEFRYTNPLFQQWRAVRAVKGEKNYTGENSLFVLLFAMFI